MCLHSQNPREGPRATERSLSLPLSDGGPGSKANCVGKAGHHLLLPALLGSLSLESPLGAKCKLQEKATPQGAKRWQRGPRHLRQVSW